MKALLRSDPESNPIARQTAAERKRSAELSRARANRVQDAKARAAIRAAFQAYAEAHGMDTVFFAGLAELIPFAPKISDLKAKPKDVAERLFVRSGDCT